ncbi:unnamed protein product, partial [Closterium sp. NIES-53]
PAGASSDRRGSLGSAPRLSARMGERPWLGAGSLAEPCDCAILACAESRTQQNLCGKAVA